MATVCGIDPGRYGAISAINLTTHTVQCFDYPMHGLLKKKKTKYVPDPYGMADTLRELNPVHVYVEEVHAMPHDGVTSSFTFGRSLGTILGVLGGLNLPVTMVRPAAWKRHMRCSSSKDQTRARAGELMPHCRPLWERKGKKAYDEGRFEAALIALYGLSDLGHLLQAPLMPLRSS